MFSVDSVAQQGGRRSTSNGVGGCNRRINKTNMGWKSKYKKMPEGMLEGECCHNGTVADDTAS